jgi:hypothetical protein
MKTFPIVTFFFAGLKSELCTKVPVQHHHMFKHRERERERETHTHTHTHTLTQMFCEEREIHLCLGLQ